MIFISGENDSSFFDKDSSNSRYAEMGNKGKKRFYV